MKTVEIISFHPGKQHNLEQAFQIHRHFSNFRHITSHYFGPESVKKWSRFSAKLGSALKKRSGSLSGDVVDIYPNEEIRFLLRRRMGQKTKNSEYIERNGAFQRWILRKYNPPKVCIGYDTSSWIVFEAWKNKSLLVLDLSIAIPQYKLQLAKEYKCSPEFIAQITQDDATFYKTYEKELALADLVLCGSQFVKDSCIASGIACEKLVVLPYGADLQKFRNNDIQRENEGVVKIVFVGFVNFRKGGDIILQAWQSIAARYPNAELHFYGGVLMEVPQQLDRVFFHGFIPQDALVEELKSAHISVLPSFFEGSSLAIYQSMAMGLAVLTTPNAGSIVQNGKDGIIVPYGSVSQFQAALESLLSDKMKRKEIARNAQVSIQAYTWNNYGEKLRDIIQDALKRRSIVPMPGLLSNSTVE